MKRQSTLLILGLMFLMGLPAAVSADYFVIWSESLELLGDGIPHSYIGDVDEDGSLEIVGRDGTQTIIRDLLTGALEWEAGPYTLGDGYTMMDVDDDGTPEILGTNGEVAFLIDWGIAGATGDLDTSGSGNRALASRPNPFGSQTTIRFELAREGWIDLRIYDVAGRQVRHLLGESLDAGAHTVDWDGRSDQAQPLSTGTYFYQLEVDGQPVETARAVILN